jgi:hypothetical protein
MLSQLNKTKAFSFLGLKAFVTAAWIDISLRKINLLN